MRPVRGPRALPVALAVVLAGCAAGSPALPDDDDDGLAPADARPPAPFVDAGTGGACDEVDGPAAALLIDDAVHPGGVWNAPMDFRMADYPLGWAIASVHASMLLRSRCIDLSPSAVLAMAIKESRLTCAVPGSLAAGDGCFQIESTSAYLELQKLFPGRFVGTHAEIVGGDHVETSALAMAHYLVFSTAMFRKYASCPERFALQHPDPHTAQKLLLGAYNRGLWWSSLPTIFTTCADHDVVDCFASDVATDYVRAIVAYTVALDAAPVFDAEVRWDDVRAYWQRLRPLYPDADDALVTQALHAAFDGLRGAGETISFRAHIRCLLRTLIEALPPAATVEDAATAACGQAYLAGTACQAGGGCPPDLQCRDDGPVVE